MSKTNLADTGGWIPCIESIAEHYDIATAMVFGVIWRFGNMHLGICDAALDKIAKYAHVSRSTAKRKLRLLEDNGFIVDMTPSERHRPHYYKDTGKAGIHILAYNEDDFRKELVAELEQPMEPIEVGQNGLPGGSEWTTSNSENATRGGSEWTTNILKNKEINKVPKTPRTKEDIQRGNLQAMQRGSQNTELIREVVEKRFHIYPNWQTKSWNDVLLFIRSRPAGETLDRFADWWYENDWRGKEGAPPTCTIIRELWPQAFKGGGDLYKQNPDGSWF